MSKAWERAFGALQDPEDETTGSVSLPRPKSGRCWRCQKNPSRVAGEDFTCEACWEYMLEKTDEDPAVELAPFRVRQVRYWPPQPGHWWQAQREETTDSGLIVPAQSD